MNNDELIAAGHELAKCLDNEPLLDIAKMIVRLADKLDVTTLALREKTKQCEQLAAENAALKDLARGWANATDDRLFEEHGETFHDSIDDCEAELKTICPATDAFLRKVRAEAILFASYHLPDGGKYQDSIQALAQEVLDGYTQVSFPVQQQYQGGAA
ncbi:hypothetical protein [Cronobacter dublinensis]|uniref:hypothetical protein n=1 Tax=Cronobacter dublinensis TaxID=413497 RepID=UPI000CFBCB04|nr:hypothetical protein [Cronobacter dublinensis]